MDEQIDRARAVERDVHQARDHVGAVDLTAERHADLVREQERKDQYEAPGEIAVTDVVAGAFLHFSLGSRDFFVAAGEAIGGRTVAGVARSGWGGAGGAAGGAAGGGGRVRACVPAPPAPAAPAA